MPAIAEKEEIATPRKFQQLKAARDYLAEAITAEEKRPDNILKNAPEWTLSLTGFLQSQIQIMRKKIKDCKAMIEGLRQSISAEETVEIVKGEIMRIGARETAEAEVDKTTSELKEIAENAIQHLETYELVKTQHYVRIAGRYAALLTELQKASTMLGGEKQHTIAKLQDEFIRYYKAHDKMKLAILGDAVMPGWIIDLRKKAKDAKTLDDYDKFAKSLELFMLVNKKYIEQAGELTQLQIELRLREAIALADKLLRSAIAHYA